MNRLAQVAKLLIQGREVIVINVHLEAFDRDTREQHTDAVLQLYQRYSERYPTMMVGDFNSSPDEADPTISRILRENLGTLELVAGRVVTEAGQISDHLPVWAVFRFTRR
ncbi:endonuclease/exonuclease/phosphatase family protein [Parapedobacter koreensis]|uniref:Endonuclease/Exonuclease/phosphatase family protein n=1 Tax=Parapedobacter koreensis TaxID=332977 RepID=A0A1H7FXH8_9SPHI|nr:hypothetical protein [Parapedobacter koreensis]SEK28115.1 Endonuclease/Exonuclease/phosphatase family protein [Parapedobacter koreensis]